MTATPTSPQVSLRRSPLVVAAPAPEEVGRPSVFRRAVGWSALAYVASRLVLIAMVVSMSAWTGRGVLRALQNWDGYWYLKLAAYGYPAHVSHRETTLGFFPLYSSVMWLGHQLTGARFEVVGLVVSGIGGFVATLLVFLLAERWWGTETARRAVVLFAMFPGSVVFSMVYSEGLLIPLALGSLLALERRRYLLAGLLAALATATGPDAIALGPAFLFAFVMEGRRSGWGSAETRRALGGLVLCPAGYGAFGAFLWAWTGSPFASYIAQRYGWHERTDLLATLQRAERLFPAGRLDFNTAAGLAGTAFLAVAFVLLARSRGRIPGTALLWAAGIGFLGLISEHTPPNARLLITAFPLVIVWAVYLRRRSFPAYAVVSACVLVGTAAVTMFTPLLRP